jgi:hypothetical protein
LLPEGIACPKALWFAGIRSTSKPAMNPIFTKIADLAGKARFSGDFGLKEASSTVQYMIGSRLDHRATMRGELRGIR